MSTAAPPHKDSLTDADEKNLLHRLKQNDPKAFDELVSQFQLPIARLAHRLLGSAPDADDLVQDVFLTVYQKMHTFRDHSSIHTWLTKITLNHCRSRQRRLSLFRRIRHKLLPAPEELQTNHPLIQTEIAQQVRFAVDQLPRKDREVIVLHYLEEHSITEIANLLEATKNTIEVRLHRARQKLKAALASVAEDSQHG